MRPRRAKAKLRRLYMGTAVSDGRRAQFAKHGEFTVFLSTSILYIVASSKETCCRAFIARVFRKMQQEPNKKREQRVTADEPDMELMKKNEHLERADRRVSALKLMST